MRRRLPLLILLAIILAGGALRAERAAHPRPGLSADEITYANAAVQLVDHRTYTQMHYPPGAPALFAVAYALGGRANTAQLDIPAAYWAQALVGTSLIVATFGLAALIASPWASVPAATVVGFHRVFVLRTDRLLSEPLAALLLVSALAALAWALGAERPPGRRLMLAGALFGALVLTRANFILAPIVVAALLGLLIARRHGARSALVAVGAFAIPAVKLRAKLVLDMVAARHPGLSRDAALSLEARRNVARYGRGRPAAFAGLLLSKLPRMWWVYSEGLRTREPAAAAALHRVLLVLSLLLLGAGLALTRHPALLAVTLVLAAISAQHMLLLALPRYAYPLLPVLYASAAAAAALLVERQRSER